MNAIRAIAMLTFREALRSKILYLFLVFAVVMISFSWILKEITVGDEIKIVKDLGMSSIHFFGVLITVFIGINLIFKEMEKRTIYLVLSKPVRRYQFLLGKFFGLAFTLLLVLCGLVAIFYLILALKGASSPKLLLSFYMIFLEWLLIAAIAIVFSSFSTPLLSTMMTLACFFAGHLTGSLLMLRQNVSSEFANWFLSALYYVLPNLELFNIRTILVHNLPIGNAYIGEATIYWVCYLSALLLLSIQIFHKKDFV